MADMHPGDRTEVPPLMAAMAAASCPPETLGALADADRAEMADLCAACPRTEACRLWLVTHAAAGPAEAPDLCPNHAHFRALSGDDRLA